MENFNMGDAVAGFIKMAMFFGVLSIVLFIAVVVLSIALIF